MFKCVCGQEFDNAQKFNNHKSHCKEHYINKYGDLALYEAHKEAKLAGLHEGNHKRAQERQAAKLALWVSEQHTCARCGKVMTEKFGSGKFCSRACANARDRSKETREKIRQALIKKSEDILPSVHSIKPKDYCIVCGKELLPNHTTPYCQKHLIEHNRQEKLSIWLASGDTGMKPDTTIRGAIRDYILAKQNHCCAICGIADIWNNKPITFILDHINGDAANSAPTNLRLICPNCDSQLDTYKSKNKNSARTARKKYLQLIRDEDKY